MGISPADLIELSKQFVRCSNLNCEFFDSVNKMSDLLVLTEHPEAVDVARIIRFQRDLQQFRALWIAFRSELKRTTDGCGMLAHMFGSDGLALIPFDEIERLNATAFERMRNGDHIKLNVDVRQEKPRSSESIATYWNLIGGVVMALGGVFTLGLVIGSVWR